MDADGSDKTRLTTRLGDDTSPAWSPDGTRIAYQAAGGGSDIWVMNADGSNQTQLTFTNRGFETTSSWLPDGQEIAFTSIDGSSSDIFTIASDGTDRINLTRSAPAERKSLLVPRRDQDRLQQRRGDGRGDLDDAGGRLRPTAAHDQPGSRAVAGLVPRRLQDRVRHGPRR
jgi:Tol biopolymer transport system component